MEFSVSSIVQPIAVGRFRPYRAIGGLPPKGIAPMRAAQQRDAVAFFSAWNQVFPEPAMTVAAIDRLVHHATIIKMNGGSYRMRVASARTKLKEPVADN